MFLALITLITSLLISAVAAWYSIIGLTALFAGAFWPIIIMGGVLEIGKLVTASWLYQNWKKAPMLLKGYLSVAVMVLMFITSMGIFGFLSKSHLDQLVPAGDTIAKVARIELSIKREQRRIDDAELVLGQLDKSVKILMDYDRVRGPTGAIATRKGQKEERESLTAEIKDAEKSVDKLTDEKFPYEQSVRNLEAEVGPVKYIAEMLYGEATPDILGQAVRAVIIIIVFVFDPLAVLLLIAANMSLRQHKKRRRKKLPPPEFAEWMEMKNPFKEKKGIAEEE